jgi:opacity protein-like surface antigen
LNYNYQINASSNIFALLGKVDLYDFHSFDPYLTLGLGVANATLKGYQESPESGIIARVSPDYQSHTSSSFTYSLGLGVDYFITPKITASLGYEYADLGNIKSGDGTSTWSGSSLSFGKLTTHTVLLSVFYQLT